MILFKVEFLLLRLSNIDGYLPFFSLAEFFSSYFLFLLHSLFFFIVTISSSFSTDVPQSFTICHERRIRPVSSHLLLPPFFLQRETARYRIEWMIEDRAE